MTHTITDWLKDWQYPCRYIQCRYKQCIARGLL